MGGEVTATEDLMREPAHEARTDFAMLLGSIFLLVVGAGAWSLDAWLAAEKL